MGLLFSGIEGSARLGGARAVDIDCGGIEIAADNGEPEDGLSPWLR